jgi:broad specificity phosphatase PhoE
VSPYYRAVGTFEGLASALELRQWDFREDPRLREQDFGNLQDSAAMERHKAERRQFGAFYYRFPQGESGADVYDRASSFFDSLHRDFARLPHPNFVVVTHGLTLRLLLMRYFYWTTDFFDALPNPGNCRMVCLELSAGGKYQLTTPPQCGPPERGWEGVAPNRTPPCATATATDASASAAAQAVCVAQRQQSSAARWPWLHSDVLARAADKTPIPLEDSQ